MAMKEDRLDEEVVREEFDLRDSLDDPVGNSSEGREEGSFSNIWLSNILFCGLIESNCEAWVRKRTFSA